MIKYGKLYKDVKKWNSLFVRGQVMSREELIQNDVLAVEVLEDEKDLFYEMALEMVGTIRANNACNRRTVMICPTTTLGQYPIFVRLVNRERLSLKKVYFVHPAEYVDDKGAWVFGGASLRDVMDFVLYSQLDRELVMSEKQRLFPDPKRMGAIERITHALGGVDVCFATVSAHGGIDFNDPEEGMDAATYCALPQRIVTMTRKRRNLEALDTLGGLLKTMPTAVMTIGMKVVLGAEKIRLFGTKAWQGAKVLEAVCGAQAAACPISLLREHPNTWVMLTEEAVAC